MNPGTTRPTKQHRRYRRRIVAWGAFVVLAIFAIGAPIALGRVQNDLEARAISVLESDGIADVTVHFSGQDGQLRCLSGPVDIPAETVAEIRQLRGVRSIDIATSCDEGANPATPATTASPPDSVPDSTTDTAPEDAATTSTTEPDLDNLASVIANDSQFSILAGLLAEADLTDQFTDEGPITVFAPNDAAFEALGPVVTADLARDPATLVAVLNHHVASGMFLQDSLGEASIETIDGSVLDVVEDPGGAGVSVVSGEASALVSEFDLVGFNGVVHSIDQVLVPDGILVEETPSAYADVNWQGGVLVLSGTVADEAQRAALLATAQGAVGTSRVVDELIVEQPSPMTADSVDELGAAVALITTNLVEGIAVMSDEGLSVEGVYVSDEQRVAVESTLADTAAVNLAPRGTATALDASNLEGDLNAAVALTPILFEQSSTTINPGSDSVLDRIAVISQRFDGISIEVGGHTDSDGLAATNQQLSEGRAAAVRDALVERGVDEATLTSVGFGSSSPVLDAAGNEDKPASRRVEFVVTLTG